MRANDSDARHGRGSEISANGDLRRSLSGLRRGDASGGFDDRKYDSPPALAAAREDAKRTLVRNSDRNFRACPRHGVYLNRIEGVSLCRLCNALVDLGAFRHGETFARVGARIVVIAADL